MKNLFLALFISLTISNVYALSDILDENIVIDDPEVVSSGVLSSRSANAKSNIRVTFLYLDDVAKNFTEQQIQDEIMLRVEDANLAFEKTMVDAKLTAATIRRFEFGDHENISNMDIIQAIREIQKYADELWTKGGIVESTQADVVFVVDYRYETDDPRCGVAVIPDAFALRPDERNSFYLGVIRLGAGCTVRNRTLAHEMGHFLGADHDHTDIFSQALRPYGHGSACAFGHTIMYQAGPRFRFFSSPLLSVRNEPCGDYEHSDNKRLFNETAPKLSQNFLADDGTSDVVPPVKTPDNGKSGGVLSIFSILLGALLLLCRALRRP